jgi:hypothetical protein
MNLAQLLSIRNRKSAGAMCLLIIVTLCTSTPAGSNPDSHIPGNVFTIIQQNCTACHQTGGIAPFPLTTAQEITKRAKQIAVIVESGFMPPWLPEPNPPETTIAGKRKLTKQQIEDIRTWADAGAKAGTAEPGESTHIASNERWPLGTPDLVLTLSKSYTVPAEGTDVVRTFVFPVDLPEDKFVRAIDFHPGHSRIAHHASFSMDDTGHARMMDQADDVPGYASMGDIGLNLSGSWGVWSPAPAVGNTNDLMLPRNIARPLPNRCDFIVEVHFNLTGKPEIIQPQVALYFTNEPVRKTPVPVTLGTSFIDIPPAEKSYNVRDSFVLPVDAQLLSIAPRAHYICTRMNVHASFADGRTLQLLRVDDWDFNWAQEYRYESPICLPAGTTIHMEFVYDNSAENPRNPNHPPQRITAGYRPIDEMGLMFLYLVPEDRNGHEQLEQAHRDKLMARIEDAKLKRHQSRENASGSKE